MNLFEVAEGDLAAALEHVPERDASGRRPVYGGSSEVPGRPALARPDPLLRILPRRHREPASGPATRPAGRASSRAFMDTFGRVTAEDALETPKGKLEARVVRQQVGGE